MVLLGVCETPAQPVSIKSVDSRLPVIPSVRNAGGTGEPLIMIQKDPVLLDVSELIWIEKKLRGADVRSAGPFVGHIQIRGEATLVVVCRKLTSVNLASLVIERRKDERLSELPFV